MQDSLNPTPQPNALASVPPALLAFCPDCGKPAGIALRDCEENRRDFPGLRIEAMPKADALRRWDESTCTCGEDAQPADAPTAQESMDVHLRKARERIAELEAERDRSDEGLRGVCLLLGFDPSDGEGTSPEEVVGYVEAELKTKDEALTTAEKKARELGEQIDMYAGWSRWKPGLWRIAFPESGPSAEYVCSEEDFQAATKLPDIPPTPAQEQAGGAARNGYHYVVSYGGGTGPDVWDATKRIFAVDIHDALSQARVVEDDGAWITSVELETEPPAAAPAPGTGADMEGEG